MDNPLPESVAGTSEPAQQRVIYLAGGPLDGRVIGWSGYPDPLVAKKGQYENCWLTADSEFGPIPVYRWVEG